MCFFLGAGGGGGLTARTRSGVGQKKLDAEAAQLTTQATELVRSGRRERALLVLKMRRLREEKCRDIDGQLAAVEQLAQTLEWETRQAEVVGALRAGNQALDAFHAEISPESVAELMNETEEALAIEREISRLVAGGGGLADYDDADALRELQALTAETSAAAPVPATGAASSASNASEATRLEAALPVAPTRSLVSEPAQSNRKPVAIPG